jgi:lipopolysaccharide/colanic/teichoic acid biosynthesis glycosyltransferase
LYEGFVKRPFDLTLSLVLLFLVAPLLLVVALAVRTRLGPGVIFRQTRVGLGGRPFTLYKFRSMAPDRRKAQLPFDQDRRLTHKHPNDPRLTPLGKFLRSWSLDELPQLWNVVRGEMSLVGPRPELVAIVEGYSPWQHLRHEVKPGLTGLWQVTARGDGMMHENTELDLEYAQRLRSSSDLKILLLTIPAVLGLRRGY